MTGFTSPLPHDWHTYLTHCKQTFFNVLARNNYYAFNEPPLRFTNYDMVYMFYVTDLFNTNHIQIHSEHNHMESSTLVLFVGKPKISLKGLLFLYHIQTLTEKQCESYFREQLIQFRKKNQTPYRRTLFKEILPQ